MATEAQDYWASEASPTSGSSIDVAMSVVCQMNCLGGITQPSRMVKVFFFDGKYCDTRAVYFDYALEQL